MVAKTFQGLEEVLRDELISIGAENVEVGRRAVSFDGDLEVMYKANLCCRTALRILKPIEKFTASDPDELYDIVREIDWDKYMTPQTTFSIDSTVNSEEFTHSKYVTYRVKDGIVDYFMDKYKVRPSIRVAGADLLFNVHIFEDRITISLDSSGEPLSKRGYRVEQTAAPINEVLAAGIIMKTGWKGECNFADPMCGSGTFLIEAALIAANINPGIYRNQFAFEKWPDFDRDLFEEIYNDDSGERDFDFKIYGGDIDPDAVAIARMNIREAKVEDMIELSCRPMSEWIDNPEPGVLVMNPPYGERLKPEDMKALYKGIGADLKKNFQGWNAWILGLNDEDFANVGLKPSVKYPILNGSLECSLREYVLFSGRYNDFRAAGGSVAGFKDEEMEERHQAPRKMKHLTDDEWKRETAKFGGKDRKKSRPADRGERKFSGKPRRDDDGKFGGKFGGKSDRGDRKFDREERKFDRGERKFDRGERKDRGEGKFGGKDRFHGDRKFERRQDSARGERDEFAPRDYRPRKPVTTQGRGPKISADNATVFSKVPIRSRRKKQNPNEE